jgi:hypothetical protein
MCASFGVIYQYKIVVLRFPEAVEVLEAAHSSTHSG